MKRTILLVEDYEDARLMMKLRLEKLGYRVLEATDGYEALDLIKEHEPDLVLMDLSLPLMDGLTATRYIKDMKDGVPVVTAHKNYYGEKAIEAGCDEVIAKPVEFNTLKTTISHYLSA
jgi:CheY-like chemotaxis protein